MTAHHIIVDCIYQENNAVLGMVSMCLAQVNIEIFLWTRNDSPSMKQESKLVWVNDYTCGYAKYNERRVIV